MRDVDDIVGASSVPLVVDLDGTLTTTDVFVEDAFAYVSAGLGAALKLLRGALGNKAQMKAIASVQDAFDAAHLPYDAGVLACIRQARAEGRKVYLATAANEKRAKAIADHLRLFDGVFASDSTTNLTSHAKADVLVRTFGRGEFDYIGNAKSDLAVWREGRTTIVTNASASVVQKAKAIGHPTIILYRPPASNRLKVWAKALRVHQYSKNALLFVPLLTSHSFNLTSLAITMIAFVAFSFAASSVYLINDLVDVGADRRHPTKRQRPLAAGLITPRESILASAIMLVLSFVLAILINPRFFGVIIVYIIFNSSYLLFLKRKMLIDTIVLSLLYTIRVWAGAVVIGVDLSNWLIIFSLFFFTSIALVKRYTELKVIIDSGLNDPSNRNYQKDDLIVVGALAAACAMNSVTVFGLYIASDTVVALYSHPQFLWIICPILLYLLGRMLIIAQRGTMNDDPVVFVMRDRIWRIALVVSIAAVLLAI